MSTAAWMDPQKEIHLRACVDIRLGTGNRCRYMYPVMQTMLKGRSPHRVHGAKSVTFGVDLAVFGVAPSWTVDAKSRSGLHAVA
jgi:hypothetical protein